MSPWLAVALLGLAYSLGGADASQKEHKVIADGLSGWKHW
jgi:hypothetical protein